MAILSWPEAQALGMSPEQWSASLPLAGQEMTTIPVDGQMTVVPTSSVLPTSVTDAVVQEAITGQPTSLVTDLFLRSLASAAGAAAGGALTNGNGGAIGVSDIVVPDLFQGPGVLEPANQYVKKRWETRVYDNYYGYVKFNFYLLNELAGKYANYTLCYDNIRKTWKAYKVRKNIVLSSNPRISQLLKLERVYNRVVRKVAKKSKALKLQK